LGGIDNVHDIQLLKQLFARKPYIPVAVTLFTSSSSPVCQCSWHLPEIHCQLHKSQTTHTCSVHVITFFLANSRN